MENKNKTLLYVVGVLLVIAVGISLAYFAASILTQGNGAKTKVHTSNIGDTIVKTEGNVEFEELDIYPGHKNISKIKITATGNEEVEYNLIWKGINTLQTSLNYEVYKSTTDENPSFTCEKKSEGVNRKRLFEECTANNFTNLGSSISTGTIATATSTTTFELKQNETLQSTPAGAIVYYYVVLEFPDINDEQNFDANGKFEGETNIVVPNAEKLGLSVDDIIATLDVKEGDPDFATIAEGDGSTEGDNSGIYTTSDPMYKTTDNQNPVTYYWRGTGETNHVVFAGKCWRIVRINGNGSVRIIYNGIANGNSCADRTADQKKNVLMANWDGNTGYYYATSDGQYDNKSYVGWTYTKDSQRTLSGTKSYAKEKTEEWFDNDANFTAEQRAQVATGYFCNDRNVGQPVTSWGWSGHVTSWQNNTTKFAYAGAKRLYDDYSPTLSCDSGDTYQLKVGAITADEVEFAGGKNENNTSYYLYTGKNYWTMSPTYWNGTWAIVFFVNSNGYLAGNNVNGTYGLRPVINLDAESVMFETGGEGTEGNPYVVS